MTSAPPPVLTAPLFRPLLRELIDLLRALGADDWLRPTVAGTWRVRDVAAHLLDVDLRRLAAGRDGHLLEPKRPLDEPGALLQFITGLNQQGVAYAQRLSPALITDLLEHTGVWIAEFVEAVPAYGPALFPVSWAGETRSEHWMDIGREYTERWHHQAQIRDAVGQPRLLSPNWFDPLIALAVRALPVAYATTAAPAGSTVVLTVTGETAVAWTLLSVDGGWRLREGSVPAPRTHVHLAGDMAWRLFFNALPAALVAQVVEIEGDPDLAAPLLRARSVIV
jgi:uncharacterized protein (TIGR03083 family)